MQEILVPLLILVVIAAIVLAVIQIRKNPVVAGELKTTAESDLSKVKELVDSVVSGFVEHGKNTAASVTAVAQANTAAITAAVAQPVAVTTAPPVAPVAAPAKPDPMPSNVEAQAAFSAKQTPQAAGFTVIPFPGATEMPAAINSIFQVAGKEKTVIDAGNGFYENWQNQVCHFESRPDGSTVMVVGYATVGPLA